MESINFEQLKAASQGKRHDEKWEVYKNVLQRLYHLSIPKIRSIMIEKLEFRAEYVPSKHFNSTSLMV